MNGRMYLIKIAGQYVVLTETQYGKYLINGLLP
jgi:hypothetical protein